MVGGWGMLPHIDFLSSFKDRRPVTELLSHADLLEIDVGFYPFSLPNTPKFALNLSHPPTPIFFSAPAAREGN
jgi:hypothetical protein